MKKKVLDVQKFGGAESAGKTTMHQHEHDVSHVEAKSKTNLEADKGEGSAAIVRCFTFGINHEAFKKNPLTKQQLFNLHIKGIETMLWRDGMTLMLDVEPRILFEDKVYKIFVGARPMRGHILREVPQTLKQIANG